MAAEHFAKSPSRVSGLRRERRNPLECSCLIVRPADSAWSRSISVNGPSASISLAGDGPPVEDPGLLHPSGVKRSEIPKVTPVRLLCLGGS